MFINLTNHPSDRWSEEQRNAALEYGQIVDIPFPQVPPEANEDYIALLADSLMLNVLTKRRQTNLEPIVVHLAGEHTLVYALVSRLRHAGIRCVASTTQRVAEEEANGMKLSQFRFVRFREYR